MKIFEIKEKNKTIGTLLYYEKEKSFIIELKDGIDEWTAPLLFTSFVKRKIFTIPKDVSMLWVKERIIPSDRQNIGSILSKHKLKTYDEMRLLELSEGRCAQDELYIKKIDELPAYVAKRMEVNVEECVMLEGGFALCFFANGEVKKTALSKLRNIDGIDKILDNKALYISGKVGTGGYSVTFNNSIDIPTRALYEAGEDIPLSKNDFLSFAKRNIIDTSECREILEYSRQNISYMIDKKKISPIKEDVKGNIYLKGDVLKNRW